MKATWAALAGVYDAPESALVLDAMDTPSREADELSTKTGTVQKALDAYAAELRELRRRKEDLRADIAMAQQMWADADAIRDPYPGVGSAGYGTTRTDSTQEDAAREAGDYEMGVLKRMADLQEDVYTAQRTCANAIVAVFGGKPYRMNGQADVKYERLYGFDADDILAGAATGATGWSQPRAYSDEAYGAKLSTHVPEKRCTITSMIS